MNMIFRSLVWMILLVILPGCKGNSTNSGNEETHVLSGIVRSNFDDTALADATVIIRRPGFRRERLTDEQGSFLISDIPTGTYQLNVLKKPDFNTLITNGLLIEHDSLDMNVSLQLKYNLVSAISSAYEIVDEDNLIDNYQADSDPIILNNDSIIRFEMDSSISVTDTVEFAYSHTSQDALFYQYIRISFENSDTDDYQLISNQNDGKVRTWRFLPDLKSDGDSNRVRISIDSDSESPVSDLKIYYFVSY